MVKIFVKIMIFTLPLLLLAACSAGGSDSSFPTGRFVSVSSPDNSYEFGKDNTWSYYLGKLMGAKGTYRVENNLWIEEGTDECPFPGTYEWTYDGKTLTFKLQGEDACVPRREATDGQSFTLAAD